jgi:hypothetical protein
LVATLLLSDVSRFTVDMKERAMNNRTLLRALAFAALAIAAAVAIGIGAYNAGVAQGIAESGRAIAAPPAGAPVVYVWPRPWGFGFGFFPFFFFLVFLFIVLRGLMWRGAWRGRSGCRYGGVPPAFEEWHRRAHEQQTPPAQQPTSTRA